MSGLPDGYELVRPLGEGGFGEVVLARHTALDRLVAVKRIHAHLLAGPASVERFRREARVLAGLAHPAIVRVYDFRQQEGDAQLVMEYVEGAPLDALIEQGPLLATRALRALEDVAAALTEAAAHGIAHRDVKPGNVFVLPDGHAKLGDFGLARIASDPSVFRTSDGTSVGTPAYLPPEVGQGTGEPDARSDAYSFAVMAYEVLTGRLPFEGMGAIAMIAAHMSEEPPRPVDLVPAFPETASEALLAGLAKDPAARPLPAELVRRLRAVPEQAWPVVKAVPRPRGAPTVVAAAGPRPLVAVPVPPPAGDRGADPGRARRSVRMRWVAAGLLVVALVVAAFVALRPGSPGDEAFQVSGVTVAVTPADGHCPGTTYELVATLSTNGRAGSVTVQWVGPNGAVQPSSRLQVPSGARSATAALSLRITGQRAIRGRASVRVFLSGPSTVVERTASSPELRYTC